MKHIFKVFSLALLVGAMFTFSSCKKDNQELIIGTWSLTEGTSNDPEMSAVLPMMIGNMAMEFTEDGVVTTAMTMLGQTQNTTGTYTIDGDKLTMIDEDGETSTATIKELTKKKLTLSTTEDSFDITLTFEKTTERDAGIHPVVI